MATPLSRTRKIYEQLITMYNECDDDFDESQFEKLLDKVENTVQEHIRKVA